MPVPNDELPVVLPDLEVNRVFIKEWILLKWFHLLFLSLSFFALLSFPHLCLAFQGSSATTILSNASEKSLNESIDSDEVRTPLSRLEEWVKTTCPW